MTDYSFPGWRRALFVAILAVILAFTLVSSVTQGTVHLHVAGSAPGGLVSHVFVKFSEVSLHTAGYPRDSGWVTLTNLLPKLDLVPQPNDKVPQTLISSQVQSGRYDEIRLVAQNATIVVEGTSDRQVSVVSTVSANVTLGIPPNGSGDVLVLFSVDYSLVLADSPQVSLNIVRVVPS